ncbi:MAG: hypothetical protein Q8P80_01780 [Candidatus Levybacteria bacterium]|nr:hypothetical protein [Candidatus Levybacteria bacterium]
MEYFKNLHWKGKLLVGFIGLSIFYAIIFYIALPKNPKVSENLSQNNSSSSQIPTAVPPSSPVSWKIYQTDQFEISHPSDWKVEKFSTVNGEVTTRIKPNYLSNDEYYPSIDISVESSSRGAELKKFYEDLWFKKSQFLLNNQTAVKYESTSPVKQVGKQEIKSPVQEIEIFIESVQNKVYYIEYKYEGAKPDEKYEILFNRIIISFKPLL